MSLSRGERQVHTQQKKINLNEEEGDEEARKLK